MTKDELLAVLDMSEDEQWEWCVKNVKEKTIGESLADLAFRLRDEVVAECGDIVWHKAVVKICDYMRMGTAWFKNYAKPIHWIIAALIAKQKDKENENLT